MFAARSGERVEAITLRRLRIARMRSRRQRGQFNGSWGDELGWGTRIMGCGPVVRFRCVDVSGEC